MPDDRPINMNTNLVSFKNVDISGVPNRKNSRGDGYVPQEEDEEEEKQEIKNPEFMDDSMLRKSLDALASLNTPIKIKEELKNNKLEIEIEIEPDPKRNIFKEDPIS